MGARGGEPEVTRVREAAVAGRFYPGDAAALRREVDAFLGAVAPRPAIGVVAPHAGYVYSGKTAGKVYAAIDVSPSVVVLAPNHTGLGSRVSIIPAGVFRMPGGDVPIDEELAAAVMREVPMAKDDARAHLREHALEVQLPFLVARRPDVRIVPVVLGGLSVDDAIAVGEGIARAAPPGTLVVASSDMSHYLGDAETRAADQPAIDAMLALDARRLFTTVETRDISMCGYLPATAMLAYARARAATSAELVAYATSGDAFGDRARVVGYAGVVVR